MNINWSNVKDLTIGGKSVKKLELDGQVVWEKGLPYDSEVEYLECTRQQWIDTGISLYNVPSFSFEIDFEPTANYDFNAIFCINSSTVNEGWMYSTGSSVFRLCSKGTQTIYASLNNKHIWKLDWTVNGFTYTLDNTTQSVNYTTTEKINTLSPLWLLHRVDYATGKLYGFKLWKENVLVMDLIPVRVGTKGYMYDKISRQLLGNAGTGDFILGNDIEYYDYLQNDGVAYIDTGIIGGSNISTEFKFRNLGSANRFIYGGTGNYTPVIVQSNYWFNTRYTNVGDSIVTTIVLIQVDQNDHTIRFNFNNSILWDGVEYASNLSIKNDTKTLYLFSSSGTQYTATARIYYCRIYDNGTLVRDYKPCLYNGEAGLWDLVEGKFYGNANNTGTLTVGNDE